jgi:plasmid maintenance system antidote protein VapI
MARDVASRSLTGFSGTTAEFWLGLEQDVDCRKAARKSPEECKRVTPLKSAG